MCKFVKEKTILPREDGVEKKDSGVKSEAGVSKFNTNIFPCSPNATVNCVFIVSATLPISFATARSTCVL